MVGLPELTALELNRYRPRCVFLRAVRVLMFLLRLTMLKQMVTQKTQKTKKNMALAFVES